MEIEKEILDRIKNGDTLAFEHVYKLFYSQLSSFASRFVFDDAHEVVQDCLLKLWENRDTILEIQSLRSYLYRSVRNACLNIIKHREIDNKYQHGILLQLREKELQFFNDTIDPKLEEDLHKALDEIPEQRRKIFFMSFLEGYKAKEISEIIGISERTVHTHVYNAMKFLKNRFKDYNFTIIIIALLESIKHI